MSTDYKEILFALKTELYNAVPVKLSLTNSFFDNFKNNPGVYLIYDKDALIYAGESGNLRKRMMDIRNTQNHNIRRLLGEKLYSTHKKVLSHLLDKNLKVQLFFNSKRPMT